MSMTKAELIQHIENNYPDDEPLTYQVMTKSDVETAIDEPISDEMWRAFTIYNGNNTGMDDSLSNEVAEWYTEFSNVIYPTLEEDNG